MTPSGTFAATRDLHGRADGGPALDRATRSSCPCLGLALAAGGTLWAGLGSALVLLLA